MSLSLSVSLSGFFSRKRHHAPCVALLLALVTAEVHAIFSTRGNSLNNPQLFSSVHVNVSNVRGLAKVRGDSKGVKFLGAFDSFQGCEAAFRNYSAYNPLWEANGGIQCRSYSFFHPQHTSWNGNSKWAGQCFAVVDEHWEKQAENFVTTSRVCLVDREVLGDCLQSSCATEACFSCPVIFGQPEPEQAQAKDMDGDSARWDLVN